MVVLTAETCWALNEYWIYNKISGIKLVSLYSNQNTFYVQVTFRAVYEIMLKKYVQPYRPQMAIWRMRIACWIPKATDEHSEYVIIIAFPLQQWLHIRSSVLRYTYMPCLVQKLIWSKNINWTQMFACSRALSFRVDEHALVSLRTCGWHRN